MSPPFVFDEHAFEIPRASRLNCAHFLSVCRLTVRTSQLHQICALVKWLLMEAQKSVGNYADPGIWS